MVKRGKERKGRSTNISKDKDTTFEHPKLVEHKEKIHHLKSKIAAAQPHKKHKRLRSLLKRKPKHKTDTLPNLPKPQELQETNTQQKSNDTRNETSHKENSHKENISLTNQEQQLQKSNETDQKNAPPTTIGTVFTTKIDHLHELVQKQGNISLTKAAKEMQISPAQVETMAQILNKHDLIKLDYPYVGGARLLDPSVKIEVKEGTLKKPNKFMKLLAFTLCTMALAAAIIYYLLQGGLV